MNEFNIGGPCILKSFVLMSNDIKATGKYHLKLLGANTKNVCVTLCVFTIKAFKILQNMTQAIHNKDFHKTKQTRHDNAFLVLIGR